MITKRTDDGPLDILQLTVQLEEAASEAWKPMIRETILSCNDAIAASKSNHLLSIYLAVSNQNVKTPLQKFRTKTQKCCTLSPVKIAAFYRG